MTALIIVVCWFLGLVGCPIVASNKNRSVSGWLTLGLVFGLFAFITVALLPTLPDEEARSAEQASTRDCPHCLSRIPQAATVCRYCQRDVPAMVASPGLRSPASDAERRRMFSGQY